MKRKLAAIIPAVFAVTVSLGGIFASGCTQKEPAAPVAPTATSQQPAKPMSASEQEKMKQKIEQEAKQGKGE